MEQSQLFDDNPFEALLEDFDGEQRSPEQPISLSTASQQPLTTSEVELEAIRAQQRALLQASPTSSTTLTQPPANPSTLLEAAAQAAETAANNTGNLQTSEEEKEETPSERGVDAAGDGSGNFFNITREEQRRTQPTAPLNQDLNEMLRAIQEQNQQMMSSMGIQLRNMQAELSTLKAANSTASTLATPSPAQPLTKLTSEDLAVQFPTNPGSNHASPGSVPGSTQPLQQSAGNLELMLQHSLNHCKMQGDQNQKITAAMVDAVQKMATSQLQRDARTSLRKSREKQPWTVNCRSEPECTVPSP